MQFICSDWLLFSAILFTSTSPSGITVNNYNQACALILFRDSNVISATFSAATLVGKRLEATCGHEHCRQPGEYQFAKQQN
jgi:hypothetical protein